MGLDKNVYTTIINSYVKKLNVQYKKFRHTCHAMFVKFKKKESSVVTTVRYSKDVSLPLPNHFSVPLLFVSQCLLLYSSLLNIGFSPSQRRSR